MEGRSLTYSVVRTVVNGDTGAEPLAFTGK